MTKKCYKCKRDLALTEFRNNNSRKDGLQSQCKHCQKTYKDSHYQKHKVKYLAKQKIWDENFRQWYREYKSQFKCIRCPENHPSCIQFHHTKKNKIDSVAALSNFGSKKKVIEEIQKCIPLCANCHAKEHWKE